MRLLVEMFKHLPRDLASVDPMKQTCVIVMVFMHILPDSNQNHIKNSSKTLKSFPCTRFHQTKWCRASDFFQNSWAEVTHGAKNGGSFSEMMGPLMIIQ